MRGHSAESILSQPQPWAMKASTQHSWALKLYFISTPPPRPPANYHKGESTAGADPAVLSPGPGGTGRSPSPAPASELGSGGWCSREARPPETKVAAFSLPVRSGPGQHLLLAGGLP